MKSFDRVEQISYNTILLNQLDRFGGNAPFLFQEKEVNQKYALFAIYGLVKSIELLLVPFSDLKGLKKWNKVKAEDIVSMTNPFERAKCFDALMDKMTYLMKCLKELDILPTRDKYAVFEGTLEDIERIKKGEISPP